ncbi:MAG TPA: type II toxin-antitoxin system VapC family toxin [Longimicrobium sp.]|jgi:predicted nucleic acid-binding protein|uniref:type II toxin-antitoxin system VapC family toxin n=1 Tax=Longimicrobium sp. TaxID=2029185 RepID=UPI002EDB936D
MPGEIYVIDTNVLLRHSSRELPRRRLLSAVVVQEMAAGADSDADLRRWAATLRDYRTRDQLLTPDGEDWYEAGKILNALIRGKRSWRAGRTSAISREEQQRLLRDVLIARSARRVNAVVVTYNAGDFRKIRRFCDVRVIAPADLF